MVGLSLMLKELTIVYQEGQAERTPYTPLLRLLAGSRIMLFPNTIFQFRAMELTSKLYNPTRNHDPLYFLVHNYYISKKFTLRERVRSAMNHHRYELNNYNCEYASKCIDRMEYCFGSGLLPDSISPLS